MKAVKGKHVVCQRALPITLSVLTALLLCACGTSSTEQETTEAAATTETTAAEISAVTSASAEESTTEESTAEESTAATAEVVEEDLPAIAAGDTITTENFEFTLNKVEFSYDVMPDNPPQFYSHYAADAGQVYLVVDADVKNLAKQAVDCDAVYSVTADYNNGYTYEGFSIVEDTDGDFTYANITQVDPLQTLGIWTLIDMPEEVDGSEAPLTLSIVIDGEEYQYVVREGTGDTAASSGEETSVSEAEPLENQEISLGETVTLSGLEFTLNKVEFSHDVVPDNPPDFYSHYEADAGQVYLVVDADVKNTGKAGLACDEIYAVTADYNDGYTYEGFSIVEDTDGDFTYANITQVDPLQTLGVWTLIDLPEEVETSDAPLVLTMTFADGSTLRYTVR